MQYIKTQNDEKQTTGSKVIWRGWVRHTDMINIIIPNQDTEVNFIHACGLSGTGGSGKLY